MTILLDDEDALFDTKSFAILHKDVHYFVDPTVFFNFSRRFATLFQYQCKNPQYDTNTGKPLRPFINSQSNFDERAFASFVACCQMKPIAPSGSVLVDLLVIAENWDSPAIISKIEACILSSVPPNEIVSLYVKILKQNLEADRLQKIITRNLPRYINAPRFSSLPFHLIESMILNYTGKLTPSQLLTLTFAASLTGGIESLKFIKRYSFDNMSFDEINELCSLFDKCPYRPLKEFFSAIGNLISLMMSPINEHIQFQEIWDKANVGTAKDAFKFFVKAHAKLGDSTNSITEETFLRLAAERGHARSQYLYGSRLLELSMDEEDEDNAVEYLIQAAAKGINEAKALLEPYLNISFVNIQLHEYVYRNLALQINLLSVSSDNYESVKQSIIALNFSTDSDLLIFAQTLMKAIQIRQRSVKYYAQLINDISKFDGYRKLKQNVFSLIILSLFVPEPRHLQFIYLRFLFKSQTLGLYSIEEITTPLMEFLKSNGPVFVNSSLMVFYWFAPLIDTKDSEIFSFLFGKLVAMEHGKFGNLYPFFEQFQKSIRSMKDNHWATFTLNRKKFYKDPLLHALIYDSISELQLIAENKQFDVDMPIDNYIIDLSPNCKGASPDDKFSLLQFAAMQGSKSCFLYLLKRGALFLDDNEITSATCSACGQCKFILSFITNVHNTIREEMFRMAGKFNNMFLLLLLMQKPINVNCSDSRGSTSLHYAIRNNNNSIVELLSNINGININSQDENGVTPFHYAVFAGKTETARILSRNSSIDVNCQDKHGSTPLHYAVWNNDIQMVQFLLGHPDIDVNATAKLDRTPLHEASKCGFLEIVRILVSYKGIDLNPKDRSGRTPFKLAMRRNQIDVVQFLGQIDHVEKNFSTSSEDDSSSQADPTDGMFQTT